MAGFISPGLGFASGIGAFIGGAAHQINQNIEQERNQDRQDDLLWMNKFERGRLEYEKEKEKTDQKTQAYNAILQAAGGDKKLADQAFIGVGMDPKHYFNAIDWIQQNRAANPGYKGDPNYQSNMMNTIQSGLTGRQDALQNIHDTVRPEARKFMNMPSPYSSPGYNSGQPQQANQTITAGQPNQTPQVSPTPQLANQPSGQPDQLVQPPATNTPTPISDTQPTTGALAVPGTEPAPAPTPPRNTISNPNGGVAGPNYVPFKSTTDQAKQAQPPADPVKYADRTSYERALIAEGRDPKAAHEIASGAITAAEDRQLKLVQFKLEHPNYNRTKLQDVYAARLDKDIAGMQNASELAADANNAITMIKSGGLKTNASQPIFDMFNRMLSSVGVDELQKMGLANRVSDYNTLNKIITRLQFGQIPNYHLGRWTEREVGMLNQMIISGATDENTNIKIALLIKNSAERGMNHTMAQSQLAGSGSPEELTKAMAMRTQQLKELADPQLRLPWIDVNLTKPQDYDTWKAAKPGTWFNDISTGRMSMKPYS